MQLNKRHQMRMTSGDSRRGSNLTHNMTRSLIEDGSEDFTNIEEKLMEDTKISCRHAVASSLNNVSQSKYKTHDYFTCLHFSNFFIQNKKDLQ